MLRHHFYASLLVVALIGFSSSELLAQRTIGTHGLIFDDNAGKTITMQMPTPIPWTGNLDWIIPVPPTSGASSGFTYSGFAGDDMLVWLSPGQTYNNGTTTFSGGTNGAWIPKSQTALAFLTLGSTAGGDLSGTYPNPSIANSAVTLSKINTAGAVTGNVITYDGSNLVWQTPVTGVTTNSTLTGNGTPGSLLGLNLGNSNTWTANQTFAGTFLITANSRIAMTNSDNNARDIRFQEPSGTGSQYIGLRAPSVTNNGNYLLPAVVGSVGQVMTVSSSNGVDSATMAWTTVGASGTAGGDLAGTYPNPSIANDAITSAKILDGTIQNSDIAATAAIPYSKLDLGNSIQNFDIVPNAITTSKVANGTVTTSKMADSAISGLKLLSKSVTYNHMSGSGAATGNVLTYDGANVVWSTPATASGTAGGDLTGTYPNPSVANDAITSAKILDGTIQNSDIAATAAIPYSKLNLNNSIQNFDIVPNAITTSKVANGTVTTSKMADSAISGLKLLSKSVTYNHMSGQGAATGNVLTYDGANVVWSTPATAAVTTNSTLTGNGTSGSPLGLNLGNSNTWTANQTFAGTFLITANSRIAMTNSDNNARDIRFQEPSGTGSQYIGLRAPSVTNNGNYLLPAVVGSVGQVMTVSSSNGVDSATMAWTTVGASGTAGGDLTGTYPNPSIANNSITSAKILDGTIQGSDIAAGTFTTTNAHYVLGNNDNIARELRLTEPSGSGVNYTAFKAQAQAGDITYTLPNTAPTAANQVLQVQSVAGNNSTLTWGSVGGSSPQFARTGIIANAGNTSYNMVSSDNIIGLDMSAGTNFTVNLLPATTAGEIIVIKIEKYNNALLPVLTLQPNGTDKVDGANNLAFGNSYGVRRLYSDGAGNWYTW